MLRNSEQHSQETQRAREEDELQKSFNGMAMAMMRKRFIYRQSRNGEGLPGKHIPSHSGIRGASCGGSNLGNREERTKDGGEGWREGRGMRGEKERIAAFDL
jgi:hypothetical protein